MPAKKSIKKNDKKMSKNDGKKKPDPNQNKAKTSKLLDKKDVKVVEKKEKELPPLPSNLTAEQLVEFKEAFELFCESEEQKIPALGVVTLMRKLGLMPSDEDVQKIIEELDPEGILAYDGLAFEHFCCVAAKKIDEVYRENDVIEAFKTFDGENTGILHIDEIKRILTKMGDPLNEDELDALVDSMEPDANGNVKYDEFVKEMMLDF